MLSRKKTYLLLTATVIVALLHSCAADNVMRKGEKFLAMGEYYDAAEQFKKAYSKTPAAEKTLRGQRALKMAQCYQHISSTQKALSAYRNAIRYNVASLQDRLCFARLLLKNGEYKNALAEFEELKDSMPADIQERTPLCTHGSKMERTGVGLYCKKNVGVQLQKIRL